MLLAILYNLKLMQKKYNTSTQTRYFKNLSIRLEYYKSIKDIDKEYRINIRANFC